MSVLVTATVAILVCLLVYYFLHKINKQSIKVENVFAQAKQLKYLTDGVFSMGKVRQQYQSVRKWYIENNPTKKIKKPSSPSSPTPFFLQSVSALQMSSISQIRKVKKLQCQNSLSHNQSAIYHFMECYSLLNYDIDSISLLFDHSEHLFIEKNSPVVTEGCLQNIYIILSGQVQIQEEGKAPIILQDDPFSSFLQFSEVLLILLHSSFQLPIRVQALTNVQVLVLTPKEHYSKEALSILSSLISLEFGRCQRVLHSSAIQKLASSMHSPVVSSPVSITNLFPQLHAILEKNQSQESSSSTQVFQQQIAECIGGSGDEILTLHKNQLLTLPPYTIIIVLSGKIAQCEGEVSIIHNPGIIIPTKSHDSFYIVSTQATLLFLSYRGDLHYYTLPTLSFLVQYLHLEYQSTLPFFDRRVKWKEQDRGDCILQETDEVKNAIILISGRFRSTRQVETSTQRYKLKYQLSYDGRHVFTEQEKEEIARNHQKQKQDELQHLENEVVISEYGNDSILFFSRCMNQSQSTINLYCTRRTEILLFPTDLVASWLQQQPINFFNFVESNNIDLSVKQKREIQNIATISATQNSSTLEFFSQLLYSSLSSIQPTSYITSKDRRRLHSLSAQENTMHMVLVGNSLVKGWNEKLLEITDAVLLVVNVCDTPLPHSDYLAMSDLLMGIRREVVFVREFEDNISETAYEMKLAEWRQVLLCLSPQRVHHCIIHNNSPFIDLSNNRSDIRRIARYLTNTAIGVVMSGGGARGYSHVGVLKAMEELSIPVDFIGGTSMGSYVGGVASTNRGDYILTRNKVKKGASMLASIKNQLFDLTLPVLALTRGNLINRVTKETFGDHSIEDSIIPFFCICTDITNCKERIVSEGPMWRFVRASMSIMNYFPPIGDSSSSHANTLVDGGYVNNVPSDVMCQLYHPNTVITINVEGYPSDGNTPIHDTISGFGLFFKQLFPHLFGEQLSKASIEQKLMYTWSENRRIDNLLVRSDVVIRPPIRDIGLGDNDKYTEIENRGYVEGKRRLSEWLRIIPKNSTLYNALYVTPKFPFDEKSFSISRSSSYH